jgi:photosystem II stability/assembly factor-like uncharacterized protein
MKLTAKLFLAVILLIFALSNMCIAQVHREKNSKQSFKDYTPANNQILPKSNFTDQWNNLGPKGLVANAFCVDPSNSNKLIAGSIAGLFITTNGGTNWSIVNSSFYNMNVYYVKMHPTDHNIILTTVWNTALSTACIYRSSDNGATWTNVKTMNDINNGKIVFAKSNPNIVYAEGGYLYKSTDAGVTWTEITTLSDINTLDVYPLDANKVYLQLYNRDFYRSDDGGSNFTKVVTCTNRFEDMVINPANSSVIYAGSNDRSATGGYGFITSLDGGATWSTNKIGFGTFSKIAFITLHPDNSNVIYVGGSGTSLMKSTNAGANWTDIMSGVSDNYSSLVDFDAQRNIYVACGSNIFKSSNESTWQSITSSASNTDVFKIVFDPTNLKTFYAATLGGVYKTTDGGANWVEKNTGIIDSDIWTIGISPFDHNTLFAGTYGGILYRSTDGGNNWTEKTSGLTGLGGTDFWEMWFHPQTAGTLYLLEDGNRIFLTTNNGDSWSEYKVNNTTIYNLYISNSSKNIWYAYASGSVLYRSSDYGSTWTSQSTTSFLYYIAVDSGNPNTLYAEQWVSATSSYNFAKSTDAGITWNSVYTNFNVRDIFSLPVSPYSLYASTWSGQGVIKSTDDGVTWNSIGSGLTCFSCFQVRNLPGYSTYLFVTTYGGGIYGFNYTPTAVEKDGSSIPKDYVLEPNYPNPFNPSTTISFSIPKSEFVTLKVFDLLGREVSTLLDERLDAGKYKLNFNGANLASGVYLFNLRSPNFSKTNKMNLLK